MTTFSKTYREIAYRTGCPARCTWGRVLGHFLPAEALDKQAELARMGYHSVAHPAGFFDVVGLPEGWTADSNDSDIVEEYDANLDPSENPALELPELDD